MRIVFKVTVDEVSMVNLSELIAQGKEMIFSNGKQKNIVMKMSKHGWTTRREGTGNGAKKGTSKSVALNEDPVRYIKKLYANQYKIVSPAGVVLDW